MSVPARRTYRAAEDRKAQILDCALAAFAESGFHATSIGDVCARAGIGRATLYQYFDDKRALLIALVERTSQKIVSAFTSRPSLEVPPGFKPTVEQAVQFTRARIAAVLRSAFDDPDTIRLVFRAGRGADGMVDSILQRIDRALLETLEAELSLTKKAGLIRDVDTHFVARFVLGGYEKVLLMYLDEDRPIDFDAIASEAAMLEMCGLFPRE
jgi:AcrR family transcriptional regulator